MSAIPIFRPTQARAPASRAPSAGKGASLRWNAGHAYSARRGAWRMKVVQLPAQSADTGQLDLSHCSASARARRFPRQEPPVRFRRRWNQIAPDSNTTRGALPSEQGSTNTAAFGVRVQRQKVRARIARRASIFTERLRYGTPSSASIRWIF